MYITISNQPWIELHCMSDDRKCIETNLKIPFAFIVSYMNKKIK